MLLLAIRAHTGRVESFGNSTLRSKTLALPVKARQQLRPYTCASVGWVVDCVLRYLMQATDCREQLY